MPTPSDPTASYRVLLVEDNPADVDLLKLGLARSILARFEVTAVSTLAEAKQQLREMSPDVVVLDLGLPDASGVEGLSEVVAQSPELPVVVLTGRAADDEIAMDVLQAGAQDYMSKSDDDWTQLARTLRYAIERHGVQQQLRATTEQLRRANDKLEHQMLHDPLTGLLNRRGLAGVLPGFIAAADHEGSCAFALMADLDDFRRINERLGYSIGNVMLREAATQVRQSIRARDVCGRLGGDELMILFTADSEAQAWNFAERIRLALTATSSMIRQRGLQVTASFALVRLDSQHRLLDQVMANAHEALLMSKQMGKNRVSRLTPFWDEELLVGDRARALDALTKPQSFHHLKQPIVRLSDNKIVGFEYLSRFTIASYEAPSAFIPLAMEANLLTTVDHTCLQGCIALATQQPVEAWHHFNLMPSTLLSMSSAHLREQLQSLSPQGVSVEVSVRHIVGAPRELVDAVQQLRRGGIRLTLDEVGFGYSCLESLIGLQPQLLKLDRCCIRGINEEPTARAAFERMLRLSTTLDAEVVVDGVQTEAERDTLRDMGVSYAQGPMWPSTT